MSSLLLLLLFDGPNSSYTITKEKKYILDRVTVMVNTYEDEGRRIGQCGFVVRGYFLIC